MSRYSRFPLELKNLFRAVISDCLVAMKDDQPDHRIKDVRFSPEGRGKYETLKQMIDTNPDLESRFLDSRAWCNDDEDRALSLDVDVRRYIRLAIDRQVALGRFELTEDDFEEIWREIRRYALCEKLDWKFTAPVKHLVMQGADSVSFARWCKIRPLAEDEIKKPKDEDRIYFDPPARYGIELRLWEEPRRHNLAPATAMEPLAVVLAVLRLYKAQPVWLTSVTASSNSPFDRGGLTWSPFEWTGYRVDPYCSGRESYLLEGKDVKRLSSSWKVLWSCYREIAEMRRSLDLYNEAFEQSTRVAAFLRVWGAIEAAFVPSGTRKIGETAAKALAELLEPAGEARDNTKRRLREAYRHRSEAVHGGRQLSDSEILSSCAFTSRSYRRAILAQLQIQESAISVR